MERADSKTAAANLRQVGSTAFVQPKVDDNRCSLNVLVLSVTAGTGDHCKESVMPIHVVKTVNVSGWKY